MKWFQNTFSLKPYPRGCHLITSQVVAANPEIAKVRMGLFHLFIKHTSASITINENADPDVRTDMEMAASTLVPEVLPYTHTCEGVDDMPAHVKSSIFGFDITIPIREGRLELGTWQGIYLMEHRDSAGPRKLVATISGE
ncbi:MAG: YjbQ family protein [Oligoflexales bacterium]|nr:YjbQ family protein [Oligoflexales bacterium]